MPSITSTCASSPKVPRPGVTQCLRDAEIATSRNHLPLAALFATARAIWQKDAGSTSRSRAISNPMIYRAIRATMAGVITTAPHRKNQSHAKRKLICARLYFREGPHKPTIGYGHLLLYVHQGVGDFRVPTRELTLEDIRTESQEAHLAPD